MPPRTRSKLTKASKENIPIEKQNTIKRNAKSTRAPRKVLNDKTNSASDESPVTKSIKTIIPKKTKSIKTIDKVANQKAEDGARPKRDRRLPSRFADNKILINLSKDTSPLKSSKEINLQSPINVQSKSVKAAVDTSSLVNRPQQKHYFRSRFQDHSISPSKFIPVQPCHASTPINKPNIVKNNGLRDIPSKRSTRSLKGKKELPKDIENKIDVYDFTFDPNEEPAPQKAKKKRAPRKKAVPKSKVFVMKYNYNKNISKTLETLKNAVNKKKVINAPALQQVQKSTTRENKGVDKSLATEIVKKPIIQNVRSPLHIEPEPCTEYQVDNIDYSPSASPVLNPTTQVKMSAVNETRDEVRTLGKVTNPAPFNLQDELSFFDEKPVASSSLNMSTRHPLASPWRVEFENLPIKWGVNTYVKSNMTPALESSYINFNDSNGKKHVYTNLVQETDVPLPEIVTTPENNNNDASKWKQTSIMSFIQEVVDKSANKNRHPVIKTNSLFNDTDDIANTSNTSNKSAKNQGSSTNTPIKNISDLVTMDSPVSENSPVNDHTPLKRKNDLTTNEIPAKSRKENVATADNFFGFDDSSINDQENVPPIKKPSGMKLRELRSRGRVLCESNYSVQPGPLRAKLPVTAKTIFAPNSEAVNNLYEQMKSGTDAPIFPDKSNIDKELDNVLNESDSESAENEDNNIEESQPIALFEDIELVHYAKMNRRSYGKAKKVAFRQRSMSNTDIDASDNEVATHDSDDDNNDLSFKLPPTIKEKKVVKKKSKVQKRSKKEEKEAEAWAASFNSMCEDVDEFDLVVEAK